VNSPFGFVPIGHISGKAVPKPREYVLTTGSTVYRNDPVIISSAGTVSISAAGQTTTHLGIAADYVSDSGSAGGKKIHVYDDPGIIYKVQVGTGVTVSSITYVFNTADHITMAAGNTITKVSNMALDTIGTSSKPWIVLGLWDSPNNAWGDSAIVIVKYNQHVFFGAYAGI
jgi:hypothetical protein